MAAMKRLWGGVLSVVTAAMLAHWPHVASATEPLLSCRIGANAIAENLRIGGANQVVALREDIPVIAYYNLPQNEPDPLLTTNFPSDAGLYLHTCSDKECTSGTTAKIEGATATYSVDLSMVLQGAEQKPVIASYNKDTAAPGIRQYYCNDLACMSPTILRRTSSKRLTPHLSLSPGDRPFLVFGSHLPESGMPPVDLVTCRCAGPSCDPLPTCAQIKDPQNNGWYPATLWPGDGPALIAHGGENAAVLQCTDMDCSDGINHPIAGVPAGYSIGYTSIAARPGGLPLVAFGAFSAEVPGVPMLAACIDDNCTTATARTLANAEQPLRIVRLVIRPNGRGLVTWGEETSVNGSALRFYQCANQDCTDGRIGVVVSNPEVGHSVAMRSDGVAVVAFRPDNSGTIKLAFCGLPADLIFTDDFDPR